MHSLFSLNISAQTIYVFMGFPYHAQTREHPIESETHVLSLYLICMRKRDVISVKTHWLQKIGMLYIRYTSTCYYYLIVFGLCMHARLFYAETWEVEGSKGVCAQFIVIYWCRYWAIWLVSHWMQSFKRVLWLDYHNWEIAP